MSDYHEQGSRPTPLNQLNSTLSPALPSLTPNSSPSTPFPPSPSNEHSKSPSSPPRIPPSLGTLPLDIIDEIVDRGGPDFIFPLTNRRLLPFHISTLYRTVRLGTPNLGHFQRTLRLHPDKYNSLIRILHWDASGTIARCGIFDSASPARLFHVELATLTSLEEVHITGPYERIRHHCPQLFWFNSPKLREVNVRSSCAPSPVIFTMSTLSIVQGVRIDKISGVRSLGILLRVCRGTLPSTFEVRYCGMEDHFTSFLSILSTFRVSRLHYCDFSSTMATLAQLFAHLDTTILEQLWLFAIDRDPNVIASDFAPGRAFECPRLERLSVGGSIIFPWDKAYGLTKTPLQHVEIGPRTFAMLSNIRRLLQDQTDEGFPLKSLRMDTVYSAVPLTSKPTPADWMLPEWQPWLPKEEVEDIRNLAMQLGIEISGTTFLGLEILESEEYREALEREEEEED